MSTRAGIVGDPGALDYFRAVGTWLGHGMADLAAILDPWVSSSAVWCPRAAG
jgi:glucokinase